MAETGANISIKSLKDIKGEVNCSNLPYVGPQSTKYPVQLSKGL